MNCIDTTRLLLCAAVGLLTGCSGSEPPAADSADKKPDQYAVETARVETGSIDFTIAAQGTFTPGQGASARLAAAAPGRVTVVLVREGDHVHSGQVLARIENRVQQAQSSSAAAAAEAASSMATEAALTARAAAADQSSGLHVARLALASAIADARAANLQARTAITAAETDLKRTQAGARPQELAQADQAVRQAQATAQRAQTEADRQKYLFDHGVAPRKQVDDAETALAVANSGLESARQGVSLLRAGARPEDVGASRIRLQQAQEAAAQARASGDARVAQGEAAVRQAEQQTLQVAAKEQDARVQRATAAARQADLAAARSTSAIAEIRAPFDGIVTRRALNPGDVADTTTPVVEISAGSSLDLAANLAGADAMRVRPGMEARIAVAELPGRSFTGRVRSIGSIDPQTNLLTARIAVPNASGALRAGGYATAAIILRTDTQALIVPKTAILNHEDGVAVFTVSADNTAHLAKVTLGPEQNVRVEVLTGVKAGDRVVTLGQYELSDGAKVVEAKKTGKAEAQ